MALDDEYEDGEILEEGEEPETAPPPPLPLPKSQPQLQPQPQPPLPPRKRLHSAMQEQQYTARSNYNYSNSGGARYPPPPPPPPYQHSYNTAAAASMTTTPAVSAGGGGRREFETYSEDLIVKYPRQVARSNVLLDFACWMEHARARLRLNVEDVQDLLVNIVLRDAGASDDGDVDMDADANSQQQQQKKKKTRVSRFLMDSLSPGKALPTKACVVLLGNVHPSVLQRYRSTLGFFDACSSVPCVLSKNDETKRLETPLPELLYKFPRPPVNTKGMAAEELFYGHELTFMLRHSYGYTDELIVQPSGVFVRKSQPLGGTWELDGDLLHLKWRQQAKPSVASAAAVANDDTTAAAADEEAQAFTLDVLVSEDETMHYFNTDPLVDKTYARKTPEHLGRRRDDGAARSIRLSLIKAVVVDVPRHPDGSVIVPGKTTKPSAESEQVENDSAVAADETTTSVNAGDDTSKKFDINYYVLSEQELIQHGFPVAVEDEQKLLEIATNGGTRDRFVQTRPRSTEPASDDDSTSDAKPTTMYALDCEMCETDIGMELTRVTVVDQHCKVVYDQIVKPQSTIINYLTEFSGITPEMLQNEKCILADVQHVLLEKFLFADTVLVGHSLTSDLRALRIVHLKVADSAMLYPHQRGFPFRTSLKYLTKTYLRKDIQLQEQKGHDSAEDAISAMELVLLKLRHGPSFGIPETEFPAGTQDSLALKVDEQGKRMSLFRFSCEHDVTSATHVAAEKHDKPWQLYSSGDLSSQARSPYVHARKYSSKKGPDAKPISKVEEPLDWAALKTSVEGSIAGEEPDDVCWVEIDGPSDHVTTSDFLFRHDEWMQKQHAHCEAVNSFLQDLYANVLPEGTLLVVVPQSDLTMLRYLKALRTRSKWRDAVPSAQWTDDMQAAVTDAFRGTMDSCVFLTQK